MTTRIPTTKREKWHRKEDRWTWKSVYRTWSSPNKPRWAGTTWHLDPNANATLERLESETTLAQRRASLRRIAPAAKARKVRTVACWCFAVGGGSLGYLDRSEAKSYHASLLKSHQPIGALRRVLLPAPKKASKP